MKKKKCQRFLEIGISGISTKIFTKKKTKRDKKRFENNFFFKIYTCETTIRSNLSTFFQKDTHCALSAHNFVILVIFSNRSAEENSPVAVAVFIQRSLLHWVCMQWNLKYITMKRGR